jgi:phage terminase large subunit
MQENRLKISFPKVYQDWVKTEFYKFVFHFIYGGRGSGKSWTTALLLLILGCNEKLKILCLREIYNSLSDSVHSMLKTLIERYKFPYIITDRYIQNPYTGTTFIFGGLYRNLDKIKSMDDVNIAWIEQAEAVSKESLDVLIPTILRNKKPKIIFTINPNEETDPVWDDFMLPQRDDTYYLYTNYKNNPYVSPELQAEINRLMEASFEDYLNIYMGELRKIGDDIIISSLEYNKAVRREIENLGAIQYGVDCARYGNDSSSITKIKGLNHVWTKEYNKKSTTELARIVMHEVGQDKKVPIKIDIGGLGAGTYDTLKDHKYNVKEINFGGKSQFPDKYADIISEMWFEFKKIIGESHITPTDRLKKELTTRKYKVDKYGRYQVESKDNYKKRGYRSPDHADSFLLAHLKVVDKIHYGFV